MSSNINNNSVLSPQYLHHPEYLKRLNSNRERIYPNLREHIESIVGDSILLTNDWSTPPEQNTVYNYDPKSWRQDQNVRYQISLPAGEPIFTKANLSQLCHLCLSLEGFNPNEIKNPHPLHLELANISKYLLERCKNLPFHAKIACLNNAISEILTKHHDGVGNLELRALVPKYELLEIALRQHLYQGLLIQTKSEIEQHYSHHKTFLLNLEDYENGLQNFGTKNRFYYSLNIDMFSTIFAGILEPLLSSCIKKINTDLPLDSAIKKNEQLITSTLKTLNLLDSPSQCSFSFEYTLRDAITQKLIEKLAIQYRREFQDTGILKKEQISADVIKLLGFANAQGKFSISCNPTVTLIALTFDLRPNVNPPFASVKEKINQEKTTQLAKVAPSLIPFGKTPEQRRQIIDLLARQKLETIDQIEQYWSEQFPTIPAASAPPNMETPPAMASQLYPRLMSTDPEPALIGPSIQPPVYNIPTTIEPTPNIEMLPAITPLVFPQLTNTGPESPFIGIDPSIQAPVYSPVVTQSPPPIYNLPVVVQLPPPVYNPVAAQSPLPVHNPIAIQSPPPVSNPVIINPPVVPSSIKFQTTDSNVPVISYVDIAFEDLLNRGMSDEEKWNFLPQINRKDVLLHVHFRPNTKGKAEELARRFFRNDGVKIQNQINTLKNIKPPENGLSQNFVSKGQALLDFYYSDALVGQFQNFEIQFKGLPKEGRFYQYVYEMAKAANIHIESWDHNFAEYNWDKPRVLHLSVQALERCLHTT